MLNSLKVLGRFLREGSKIFCLSHGERLSHFYMNHDSIQSVPMIGLIGGSLSYNSRMIPTKLSGGIASKPNKSFNLFQHCIGTRQFSSYIILYKNKSSETGSQVRQNFEKECEDLINSQINMELFAGYVYSSMACYFDRDDVAMPGFHSYFENASVEELEHAKKFMVYMNQRGGRVILREISAPPQVEWKCPVEAMEQALDLEKEVNQALLDLHQVAGKHNDANLCDFLESQFLQHQIESIREIADQLTMIRRVGEGLGVYIYDFNLRKASQKKSH